MRAIRITVSLVSLIVLLVGVLSATVFADNRIGELKALADGEQVTLTDKVLYYTAGQNGYIEEPDRSAGIMVYGLSGPYTDITAASLSGTMSSTSEGERCIVLSDIELSWPRGTAPLGANNRALKMRPMDGLKVKAWGVVKSIDAADMTYVISDGTDPEGVVVFGLCPVNEGEFTTVTGAAGFVGVRVIYALPSSGTPADDDLNPLVFRWDPTQFSNGANVIELQLLRDLDWFSDFLPPVRAIRDRTLWELGRTDMSGFFGTWGVTSVVYYKMEMGDSVPTLTQFTWMPEYYGTTHWYQFRVLLKEPAVGGGYAYRFALLGNSFVATAVEPVWPGGIVSPMNGDPLLVSQLRSGDINLSWMPTEGADQYRVVVEPVEPGIAPTWRSNTIYFGAGYQISLSDGDRLALAAMLSNPACVGRQFRWRVDGRHTGDSNLAWTRGEWSFFIVGATPPAPNTIVTGMVIDNQAPPHPVSNVVVTLGALQAVTDANGAFSFNLGSSMPVSSLFGDFSQACFKVSTRLKDQSQYPQVSVFYLGTGYEQISENGGASIPLPFEVYAASGVTKDLGSITVQSNDANNPPPPPF